MRLTRAHVRKAASPSRLLIYLGVFAHGHATGHFANGSVYWGVLSTLIGLLAFALAVIVAG